MELRDFGATGLRVSILGLQRLADARLVLVARRCVDAQRLPADTNGAGRGYVRGFANKGLGFEPVRRFFEASIAPVGGLRASLSLSLIRDRSAGFMIGRDACNAATRCRLSIA